MDLYFFIIIKEYYLNIKDDINKYKKFIFEKY